MTDREALARRALAAWSDPEVIAPMADPFTLHVADRSFTLDAADSEEVIGQWRAGFSDLAWRIDDLVAAGGRVAIRGGLTGTHDGEFRGRTPTGRRIDVDHMLFLRFEGDLVVEMWELLDPGQLDRQLGG